MTISTAVNLTSENCAPDVLQSSGPVLLCFWAEWCGPCKTITPVLNELADEYEDLVKIGTINIDEQPALALKYGVRAVPTLLLLHQGQVVDQIVGPRSKFDLEDSLDRLLALIPQGLAGLHRAPAFSLRLS